MGNVVKFEAYGKEYHLSVMEHDGQKWVTAQQVGEALGNKNIKKLIYGLMETGEIVEEKHLSNVTLLNSGAGNPRRILLSYRGVIRVAMRAQGQRAREFRDWAEDVLYQVMMTGSYGIPQIEESRESLEEAMKDCIRRGFALSEALKDISHDTVAKVIHFRRLGLTQKETGSVLGMDRCHVQKVEKVLKEVGITLDGVNVRKRDKDIRERLIDNLIPETITQDTGAPLQEPALQEGGAC